jgi:hypothetical protein
VGARGDEHSSAEWHWLYKMAQSGRGEVRFGITEDGDTGLFWDAYCNGEWTLGMGDTAEDAVANAMWRHPNPDAEPVVDDDTMSRWSIWRASNSIAAATPSSTTGSEEEGARDRQDAARWRFFRQFLAVEQDADEGVEFLFMLDDKMQSVSAPLIWGHTVESLVDLALAATPSVTACEPSEDQANG